MPDRNAGKYFSYREAWARIKKARGSGFYLEAVTLEESIITDRLISFLVFAGEIQSGAQVEKLNFGKLIQLWQKRVPEPIPVPDFPDLRLAIANWRKHRNRVVHGMVKSIPGDGHRDVIDFLKEAQFVAFQGQALARFLSDWVEKAKNRTRKNSL
ncbi:MAG: hypothetical protein IPM24_17810 [Bryobacterales bacterium]|nr:hypothetical protein [Bryobacterales bacterium]